MSFFQNPFSPMAPASPSSQDRAPFDENSNACSPYSAPEKSTEIYSNNQPRTALGEISGNRLEQVETVEQEQSTKEKNKRNNEEKGDEALSNIDGYVVQLLEKIEKQKAKAAKLCSALENKEKSQHVHDLANVFEELTANDENTPVDEMSLENKSPVKNKPATKVGLVNILPLQEKEVSKPRLSEILHVSKTSINFGNKFPGQVVEECLDIVNKSDKDFVVRIEVDCLNEELQDTEEYVFSVRRSHLNEYNDRHYLIMAPYSCASFKFALKLPNLKIKGDVEGEVRVSIEDVEGSYILPLRCHSVIPKVFCPKELRLKGMRHSVIKVAVKEGKKQDFKIPIKNNGPVAVNMEMEFFEPSNEDEDDEKTFDCIIHPSVLSVPANGQAQINLIVKPSKGKQVEKNKPMRKVLVGRVRDTALMYSFVFGVEFY